MAQNNERWHKTIIPGVFALFAKRLVKLAPGIPFAHFLSPPTHPPLKSQSYEIIKDLVSISSTFTHAFFIQNFGAKNYKAVFWV
jgi:hypothetical protein